MSYDPPEGIKYADLLNFNVENICYFLFYAIHILVTVIFFPDE